MSLTLAQYRTRVRELLDDTGSARFTDAQIDAGLRLALQEYSNYRPQVLAYDTITDGEDQMELPSAFTDLLPLKIITVKYASAIDAKALKTKWWFAKLGTSWTIGVSGATNTPPAGKDLQVWYATYHTIDTLDSATESSLPAKDDELLATGAAGHAARSRVASRAELITLQRNVAEELKELAREYLTEFRAQLRAQAFSEPGFAEWKYP